MKIIWIVLALALGGLLGSWAGTQYLANGYQYAPELGPELFIFLSEKVYSPVAWWGWKSQWGDQQPEPYENAWLCVVGGVCFASLLVAACCRKKKPATSGAYGMARWSTTKEIEKQGLLGDDGYVLCQTEEARYKGGTVEKPATLVREGRLLRYNGGQHTVMFAATGDGKGVGTVIPTLLSWTHSVVVNDMKGENWDLTAGWRSLFSHCLRFNPSSLDSVKFNPMLEIRPAPYDVRDAQNLAGLIVDEGSLGGEKQDHWQKTGRAWLVACILHVLYVGKEKTLRGVLDLMADADSELEQTLERMRDTLHLDTGPHPAVSDGAALMLGRAENERSGIVSTAVSFLELYRDPIIAANTAESDFMISDLVCADRPTSLYLVVPDNDAERTRPIMRLMLDLIRRQLTEELDSVQSWGDRLPRKHRLQLVLDEFPAMGKLPWFDRFLSICRGYKISVLIICQSLSQLENTYGGNNSILDNCKLMLSYGANGLRTPKMLSDLLGSETKQRSQRSESQKRGSLFVDSVSTSIQEYGQALLRPEEIRTFSREGALVIVSGMHPYRAKKVMFYQDSRFSSRAWDRKGKRNSPPSSRERQRRELPGRMKKSYWVTRRIPSQSEVVSTTQSAGAGAAAKNAVPPEQIDGSVADAWDPPELDPGV